MSEPLDDLLERFDRAWRAGGEPTLQAFLPPLGDTRRVEALLELVMIDLEYRWRRGAFGGRAPVLEDYLARSPELRNGPALPLELIGEEYRARHRWGDRPSPADYLRRFPAHAASLPDLLRQIDAELAAEPAVAPSPALPCPWCRQRWFGPTTGCHHHTCPACGEGFRVEWPPERPPFARLGPYELGPPLGVGALGSTWQARDPATGRDVALKLPHLPPGSDAADEERCLHRARTAARLAHRCIVPLLDAGRDHGTIYLVYGLASGPSLEGRLRGGRPPFEVAARWVADLAEALAAVHSLGALHGELRPSNVLFSPDDAFPLLTDFGLARDLRSPTRINRAGQVLGGPAYRAPEQVVGDSEVDGRADLYGLGAILYELLTGEPPFRGGVRAVARRVVEEGPIPPRRALDCVPEGLEAIAMKCLEKRPRDRYATAGSLGGDLRRWLGGEPITARPPGWLRRLRRWWGR